MNESQAQHFDHARDDARQLVDNLGMPLDDGIVDTVAIFRLMGINTTASCWGHDDHESGGPYVMFYAAESKPLELQYRQVGDPRDPVFHQLRDQAIILNLRERQKLLPSLDLFYRDRLTPYGARLIITSFGPEASRLQCQNAELAPILSKPEQRNLLSSHQREMRTFTDFLISRYYKNH